MRKTKTLALYLLFLCILHSQLLAQKSEKQTLFNYIYEMEKPSIILEIDLDSLNAVKKTNTYLPATFKYQVSKKKWKAIAVEVRARGKFRRVKCDFPPLKLDFPKKALKKEGFKKNDELKLVNQCLDSKQGKELVIREYLTYELYKTLTKTSFNAKKVKIVYQDTKSKKKRKGIAIVLEPDKELEKRLKAKRCEDCYSTATELLDQELTNIQSLFQYMIGNTDWSIYGLRNIALLKTKKVEQFLPIPYDFDFSGLVNAPYAIPQPDYQLNSTRQRLYLGPNDINSCQETIDFFKLKEKALLNKVKRFKGLNGKAKKDIRLFLESFFDALETGNISKFEASISSKN